MKQFRVYRTVHYATTVTAVDEQTALSMVEEMDESEMEAIDEDEMTVVENHAE